MNKLRPEEGRAPSSIIPTVITPELVANDGLGVHGADANVSQMPRLKVMSAQIGLAA